MKTPFYLGLCLLLISCKQNLYEKKELDPSQLMAETDLDSTLQSSSGIVSLPASISRPQLASCLFVADTLVKNYDQIIGASKTWKDQWAMMFPAKADGLLRGAFVLNDSTHIIPFFIDRYQHRQIFTKWKVGPNYRYSYQGRLKPVFNSQYCFQTILQKIPIDNRTYFVGMTEGKKGQNYWQIIWTAKYNGLDDFHKTDRFGIDYSKGQNRRTLDYKIKGNELSIFLKVDSLADQQVIPLNETLVRTVDLNEGELLQELSVLF
ncbi:MAG: hypothetical protein DWQ02_00610 [Bacteroidetes bacterium]|nr:MAG: hypothetical protein DWQ02_00610 [Bacteroidota bacterium]